MKRLLTSPNLNLSASSFEELLDLVNKNAPSISWPVRVLKDADDGTPLAAYNFHEISDLEMAAHFESQNHMHPVKPALDNRIGSDGTTSYYTGFIDDYQWIDANLRKPQFRNNPEGSKLALLLLIQGYVDRAGLKDPMEQDLKKAEWYSRYLRAFIANGCKPIKFEDVKTKDF